MDRYELRIAGHLTDRRGRAFDAVELHRLPDGSTSLVVLVPDQAALHSLLSRVRDLALDLVEVRREALQHPAQESAETRRSGGIEPWRSS